MIKEQDYVMRLIKEMVRAILKLFFHIDTESPSAELLEESEQKETLDELFNMALLFYSYLNDKSDDFLEDNNFSRDEIRQGLMDAASKYGLGSMAELFLQ